jgi:peroxidase
LNLPEYQRIVAKFWRRFTSKTNHFKVNGSFNNAFVNFRNPDDIDLIIGGLSEKPILGSVFGPTLTCMLAIQFANLRISDRFWYENDLPPSSLSIEQLQAVRRVSLSGLLCAANDVTRSPPKAFIREDPYLNARLTCDHLSGLDLSAWKSEEIEIVEETSETSTAPHVPELDDLSPEIVQEALERARQELTLRKKLEYESWLEQGGVDARSPDGTAASFSKANRNALNIANSSHFYELATNELLNTLHSIRRRKRQVFDNNLSSGFNNDDFTNSLQNIDINSFVGGSISPLTLEPQCEDLTAPCDLTTPFRSFTGYCNNLRNPSLGQSLTTFARLLPSVYEDGVSRPRVTASNGQPLPSPRVVSTLIHPDISNLHTRYSLMVMQYAQFLDHDITMTPIHKGFHESIPKCRPCDASRTVHPECNPFPVPPRDHFYPEVNVTSGERLCFPFMRSLPGQQTLGAREQINQNTAFLDASQVYGENRCICQKLLGFSGRLNSTIHPIKGKELLPQSPSHPECKAASGQCFIAGDGRASEQPALTAIHTIFLREHNRIVEGLRGVNPHWSGEQLFNHARRIISAQNQHISYNEFLPRILSWNAVNLYGLKLLPQGYYKEYNPTCNPAVVTEFAAAAFRIGHSLLRPHIPRLSSTHQPIDPPILLRDGFFKTDIFLQVGMVDEISRGLVATPMETLDQFITGEVTNHLFEDRKIPFSGIDLIALNVQRARDHGIPSYNNYRALCNLKRAQNWDDLSREIPPEVISRLKRIYPTVDDIDLFPGKDKTLFKFTGKD